jgi:hypothetical protein
MPQSMSRVIMEAESARFEGEILWPSRLPIIATSPSRRSHMKSTDCFSAEIFWGESDADAARARALRNGISPAALRCLKPA